VAGHPVRINREFSEYRFVFGQAEGERQQSVRVFGDLLTSMKHAAGIRGGFVNNIGGSQ
jgi:hypothetical protein